MRSTSSSRAVTNSTGVQSFSARSRRHTSTPSRPGSPTSSTIATGRCVWTASRPASPLRSTCTPYPALARCIRMMSAIAASSSTTSTRPRSDAASPTCTPYPRRVHAAVMRRSERHHRVVSAAALPGSRSSGQPATINGKHLAVYVAGCRGGEKDNDVADVLGLAPPPGGDSRRELLEPLRVGEQRGVHLGSHVSRRDGVDVDAVARPFVAQRLRELRDGTLACGVRGDGEATLEAQQRREIDDLAGAASDHRTAE